MFPEVSVSLSQDWIWACPWCRSCHTIKAIPTRIWQAGSIALLPQGSGSVWGPSSLWHRLSLPARNLYKWWWEMPTQGWVCIKAPSLCLSGISYCNTPIHLSCDQFSLSAGVTATKSLHTPSGSEYGAIVLGDTKLGPRDSLRSQVFFNR